MYAILLALVFIVSGPALSHATLIINNASNQVFDGGTYTDAAGDCIVLNNSSNITIRNAKFENCQGVAIRLIGSGSNITIEHNTFTNVKSGLYANGFQGNGISFSHNVCENMIGFESRGQCVQFNGVSGKGHRIQYNRSLNKRNGISDPEDHINLFNSSGDASDYLQITDNYLEGGGPSTSGCGIVVGDYGGSYITVARNFLLNTGGCGIGVAGGSFIVVDSNKIYGSRTDVSNIGLTAYASTVPCSNITVSNNLVWWIKKTGMIGTYYLPTSGGVECSNRTYTNNRNHDNVIFPPTP